MNNSKFFENKECEYYPCHKGIEEINCLFCFCPLYTLNPCPGKCAYKTRQDGSVIKTCKDCDFPHKKENYEKIMKILK